VYRELVQIREKWDLLPIVAHMDRYIGPFRTFGIPERLAELPVLVQANASFFLHRSTAGMAMKLLKADRIQLLGSDAHNLTSRKPNLGNALDRIERKRGKAALERISNYESDVFAPQK
jgi:protein-tyrosine phosphatase